jgi:Immunoglobulin-like domain of bacterial spore germination
MKTIRSILVALGIMILAACNTSTQALSTATLVPPTATPVPPTATPLPPTATAFPPLTGDMLKNATYQLLTYQKTVTLKDGNYENGSGADYILATLLPQIAFGDLNGDGSQDAAVLVAENAGGSGTFVSVYAIINQAGKPLQSGAALIDDRPNIQALSIKDGQINVAALIHGGNDSMANPTLTVTEAYQLIKSGIKLVDFTTKTTDGAVRSIKIESPVSGAQASASVEVKGSMPVAPSDNTLAYRIDDAAGNKLAEGPFSVTAQTAGGPATFDNTLTLPSLASGATIWLVLSENNAGDGSVVALKAISLIIK